MEGQLKQGQLFGDYEILSLAGYGGMGIVYRAEQRALGRLVALKVIKSGAGHDDDFRARFLREARLASSVDHPHVVTVYDAGEIEGTLFLSMQWIDGLDLGRILRHHGQLEPERAVRIISQVAGALDAVHGARLLHRDVKPGNVLVRQLAEEDYSYLTDFGVAKPAEGDLDLTRTGAVVGTVGYLAPEQIRGAKATPRSDLYALGCLFFEAIAGLAPFEEENELALRWAHANSQRPLLSSFLQSGDRRYDDFVLRALAIDPEERYESGREFAKALVSAHQHPVADSLPPTKPAAAGAAATVRMPAPGPSQWPAPTPRPPGPDTLEPQQMTPGGYGYVTPAPPPPERRSSNSLALVLLTLVALAGVGVGALAASGAFSSKSSGTTTQTTSSTGTGTTSTGTTTTTNTTTTNTNTDTTPAGLASCGGGISVLGATTSCAFGQNVERAYLASTGGTTDVTATSPVTGGTYTMRCTGAVPHICTGARHAEVVFAASPSANTVTGPPAGTDTTGMHACDQNISANNVTTCPFSDNVFIAYWRAWKGSGDQSQQIVNAHSPVTGRNYSMTCTTDGTTVWCTGGTDSYVTFPLQAIHVYAGP